MSNVSAPIFAPKVLVSKVEAIDLSLVLSHALPGKAGKDTVKPSEFRLDTDSAKRSVGGAVTGTSFVKGVAYLLTRHAWGDASESLTKGLPRAVGAALTQGFDGIKQGAGLDLDRLSLALSVAMNTLTALPVKTVAPAPVAKAVTPAPAPAPVADTPAPVVEDMSDKREAVPHTLTDAEQDEAASAPARMAEAIERAAAQAAADAETARLQRLNEFRAELVARHEAQAVEDEAAAIVLCRLADRFGIKLSKVQLALLDKVRKAA